MACPSLLPLPADCPLVTRGSYVNLLDYRDNVIRERLDEVVKYSLSKGLVRFSPDADLTAAEKEAQPADWVATFKKMDLSDCHGWPLWEKEVFLILGAAYDELGSIFAYYAKSGGVGTSAASAFQLQQAEVTNFSLDCGLATKDFAMARIHNLMEQVRHLPASPILSHSLPLSPILSHTLPHSPILSHSLPYSPTLSRTLPRSCGHFHGLLSPSPSPFPL